MAEFEFRLPDIGEGVAEGEVVEWHVKAGDKVSEDAPLVEVMTDKATVQIGSPKSGTVRQVLVAAGEVARVGQTLVIIDARENGSSLPPKKGDHAGSNGQGASGQGGSTGESQKVPREASSSAATAVGDIREGLPGASYFRGAAEAATQKPIRKPLATPATRKLARELGVDLRSVSATGREGRITSEDVRTHAMRQPTSSSQGGSVPMASQTAASQAMTHRQTPPKRPSDHAGLSTETRVPLTGIRRAMAERMSLANTHAAHFTFVEECEVSRLIELKQRMTPLAAEQGIKLNFLPFIAQAVCRALRQYPDLNGRFDEQARELVLQPRIDLGIAVSTDGGLYVPVVKDAESLGLLGTAREIARLSECARTGTLARSELSGSSFTITSLGKKGGLLATPILNYPEIGILGIHRIKEKPVVRDGDIVIGQVMNLSLSFDHRLVDGDIGASFAYAIIEALEEPERLFL